MVSSESHADGDEQHPHCGCLGCRERAAAVIDHARHGRRTVCDDHARGHTIVEVLA